MSSDNDIKPEYDFKTLRKADPARHRAILARGKTCATVNQDDAANSSTLEAEFPIKPSSDLLALAGIAKSDVQVHARDHAEDEQFETEAPWERDPRVMARLLESIAQSKAGQRVEAALIDPFPKKPSDDLLTLAGIAKSDVQVDARDRAEDEQFERSE